MDYQEAINTLKDEIKCSCYRNRGYCGICTIYSEMDRNNIIDACKTAISTMQELQQYKKLGALEEVREAVEKQKEERPRPVLGIFGGEEYECRECGNTVEYMDNYCKWCGKAQDWE